MSENEESPVVAASTETSAAETTQISMVAGTLGCILILLVPSVPSLVLLYNGFSVGAALIAFLISVVFLYIFIASLGNDLMDVIVGSAIFLVLSLIFMTTVVGARRKLEERSVARMHQQLEKKREAREQEARERRQREEHRRWIQGQAK